MVGEDPYQYSTYQKGITDGETLQVHELQGIIMLGKVTAEV